jgi:hypothetical protein
MLGILKRAMWAVAPNIAYSVRERRGKASEVITIYAKA